jgi:hypothetical protein
MCRNQTTRPTIMTILSLRESPCYKMSPEAPHSELWQSCPVAGSTLGTGTRCSLESQSQNHTFVRQRFHSYGNNRLGGKNPEQVFGGEERRQKRYIEGAPQGQYRRCGELRITFPLWHIEPRYLCSSACCPAVVRTGSSRPIYIHVARKILKAVFQL